MQRKKVLFLITKSNWGGAQRYVYDLATSLDPVTYEPVVLLGGSGELTHELKESGIRTVSLNSLQRDVSITKELLFAKELWRIIKKEKPDVLHVNSSKAGGVGCFIGRIAFVPRVIFTAHGWAFNEDRPVWQKTFIKLLHWITVLLSHKTIAVSSAIVTQMNWLGAARKMIVINPGRTIPAFESRLAARTTLALKHAALAPYTADVWFCILAELHPIKQHHMLFVVMKSIITEFPHVRLICIGQGEEATKLQSYIDENQLNQNVFLTGHIHDAATLLKSSDLFVLPSKSESYGYVLHEAGLARVPVIASKVGGITDIISDETEGKLVDPKDPSELEKALRDFLCAPHEFNNRTQNLQSKLTKRTVQAMAEETVAVYNT